jgi:Lysine-specific metallo-endopeptidase
MVSPELGLSGELEYELEDEAMELEPLFSQARAFENSWPALELPALPGLSIPGTIHRLDCGGGCPPLAAAQCIPVVRRAMTEAINLANNAANKLEAPTKLEPSKRDPKKHKEAIETARLFTFFFCHDPSKPVTWSGNEASGVSVAKRFRAVAKELSGGRRMTFRCNFGALCTGSVAVTRQDVEANVINLCAPFWNPPAGLRGLSNDGFRGGTILHEMLHVLYTDFFHHAGHPSGDPEFRRDNAHCYKAFALRVWGYGEDPNARARCRARPC